ncbi:serine hydrolase domain-containing protein [Phytohabitans kaempferiae]|uniref:Serine hydrolase domain-containing protein n=1 Tax=Phytohabitans kaempferiae TaxID=1620943 RepID=A0ABV6MA85_9ACTN
MTVDGERLARLDRYLASLVDAGRLPGWSFAVSHRGELAYESFGGHRDREAGLPVEPDTIYRLWSMTKPVTSVAALVLVEEGVLSLQDPVARYIPEFADARVYRQGPPSRPVTDPLTEPIRLWHLLSHTSGLTYGFHRAHPVDEIYTAAGYEWSTPPGLSLAECCAAWAGFPLLFQPGTAWNYGVSSDVLGRVVEVASGQPLDKFFADRVFGPLGMRDTGFVVDPGQRDRLAAFYTVGPDGGIARNDALGTLGTVEPACLSGSAGLVSTLGDYLRFGRLLLGGGEVDGTRVLGPRTVAYMTRNHLPGGADLAAVGRPVFAEMPWAGVGFGLGFAVVLDSAATKVPSSDGEYGWHSAASTIFWVDPAEELTAVFLTQLMPSSALPLHSRLRQFVHQAIVG